MVIFFQTNQRVHILCGHSRPVSCLSVLDTQQQLSEVILLTGASDKLICVSFGNKNDFDTKLFLA